jgi:hypothetical protein
MPAGKYATASAFDAQRRHVADPHHVGDTIGHGVEGGALE